MNKLLLFVLLLCFASCEHPFLLTTTTSATESHYSLLYPTWQDLFAVSPSNKNKLHDHYTDFIPLFKASILANQVVTWQSNCFLVIYYITNNEATMRITNTSSVLISIVASQAKSATCYDYYLMATASTYFVKFVAFHGNHTMFVHDIQDMQDVVSAGFRTFSFQESVLSEVWDAFRALRLITGYLSTREEIVTFLQREMNISFPIRTKPYTYYLPESYLDSGDLMISTDFSGEDALVIFGTGGPIGHVAIALRDEHGELYILESTDVNNLGIGATKYDQWLVNNQHDHVAFVKLHESYRSKFDAKKAWQMFNSVKGLPYGDEVYYWGWIDTESNNFPTPFLNSKTLAMGLAMADHLAPSIIELMFIQAFNQRLQHVYHSTVNCSNMICVLDELHRLNKTFAEMYSIPEQDDWIYPRTNRSSMVCSVFVAAMYKAAGMFDPFTVTAAEFTPKDLYQLRMYESQPKWPENGPCSGKSICQVFGAHEMQVPGFNSIDMYDHMNEKCGALPTKYVRTPSKC